MALIVALIIALWTLAFADLRRSEERLMAGTSSELDNLLLAFAKEIESSVNTIDLSLLDLREHWQNDTGAFATVVRHRQAHLENEFAFQIGVIDAKGQLAFSSLDQQAKPVDLSDREHYRVHRERSSDELFVSKPILGRVSNRWTIQFTRPIYQDETFAGVIVLSVSPEYFYRFYHSIKLPADSAINLLRNSGEVLSRYPSPERALGKTLVDAPFLKPFAPGAGQFRKVAEIDGIERLYAWRKLDRYSLTVAMGEPLQAIMAPYNKQQLRTLIAAGGLTLLLIVVGYLKHSNLRRREQMVRAIAENEERWRYALESVGDGVWDWDVAGGKALFSTGWKGMLGYSPDEFANDFDEWKRRVHPDDLARVTHDIDAYFAGQTPAYVNEHRLLCKNGEWKWILARGMAIERDEAGRPTRLVGTHTDISSAKQMEEQLRRQATTDPLTGLNNRRYFLDKLEHEVARVKRHPESAGCVLMADLDHFKKINDTYGHAAGDAALRYFADLLRAECREIDTVCRIGGEEFAILALGDLPAASRFAQRLCTLLEQSGLSFAGQLIRMTVSIGVAEILPTDADPEAPLQRADQALYRAKEAGRNRTVTAGE